MSALPALSVVVPSVNGWADLEGCLDALAAAGASVPIEVLVPERCGDAERTAVAVRHPLVRVLPVGQATTIPQMRAIAFEAATAPMVAVIEDHVLVPAGWAERILAARAAGHLVVGGTVENAATERTVDWAAFLCEYSLVLQVRPAGPVAWLTGNNTAYDRALLREFAAVFNSGGWEDLSHDTLRRAGITLWYDPALLVRHRKHYSIAEYARERFTYSRAWAALHVAHAERVTRLLQGARSAVLPPILLWRIVTRTWRHAAHRRLLLRSLPFLSIFVIAWALGEWTGAWFGDGGALARVR